MSKNALKFLTASYLFGAMAMSEDAFFKEKETYREYDPKKDSTLFPTVKPKGTKYTFSDGFECYALNQKNADRKHNRWLCSKEK